MTLCKPSVSESSTVAEIELAVRVSVLVDLLGEAREMIVQALTALKEIGCIEDPIRPCGTCWPCCARLGLKPIPLH
jgi:hypothetical protein